MNATGIVVEYNPFHNGHLYHLNKTKELTNSDCVIAVMSGNWTQRGLPAVTTKWQRAGFAITQGVDLVLELPYVFATQQATNFAYGAITTLKLANVSSIVFGSECGNLDSLIETSKINFDPNRFKENMNAGFSYPKAYNYFQDQYGPNDILGVCYLREIANTNIKPYVVSRTQGYFDLELKNMASAMAIRQAIKNNIDVSQFTKMANQLQEVHDWDDYYPYLRTILLTAHNNELAKRLLVNEGIENHLIKQAKLAKTFKVFIENCITRRYTQARIQRTLVQILTQTTKKDRDSLPSLNYLRVLAYNDTGRQYLKEIKNRTVIANKFMQIPEEYRNLEFKATTAYSLPFSSPRRNTIIDEEIYGRFK